MYGSSIGLIKGDTRSLDSGSLESRAAGRPPCRLVVEGSLLIGVEV